MHGFIVNIVRYSGIPPIVIFIPLFKSSSECLYQEGTYYGYKRTHAQTFGSGVVYAFFFFKKVIGEFQGVVRASFFKEICGLLAGITQSKQWRIVALLVQASQDQKNREV